MTTEWPLLKGRKDLYAVEKPERLANLLYYSITFTDGGKQGIHRIRAGTVTAPAKLEVGKTYPAGKSGAEYTIVSELQYHED